MKLTLGIECIHAHCTNPPRPGRRECGGCARRRRLYGDPAGAGSRKGKGQRTLDVLLTIETDHCIEWPHHTVKGYGYVNHDGRKHVGVHAIACEMRHGPPPSPQHEVAHSCGNPPCLNYRHLRWATRTENMADAIAHGTTARGERRPNSRMTEADVRRIRRQHAHGESVASLARQFGISYVTAHDCISRRTWAWLDAEEVAS